MVPDISTPDCQFRYTYIIRDLPELAALVYNIDTREFTVYYAEGLGLAAPNEMGTDYFIDVIAEGPPGTPELSTSFVLTIKNPCYDPNYVEFPVPVAMPPLVRYRLAEG